MTAPGSGAGIRPIVLVVDDEAPIRKFLRAGLESQGYALVEAPTGKEAIAQAATRAPDIVLLDLGLPDLDGLEVLRRIRALDAGADDYVTKPFAMGELLARMRAAARHAARGDQGGESVLALGDLTVDLGRRRVTVGGTEVRLTPIEYRLLAALARQAGRVLTHAQLLREVWGPGYTTQHHYLRVYMAQLRHKIERDPARPRRLLTEPGVGYRLRED